MTSLPSRKLWFWLLFIAVTPFLITSGEAAVVGSISNVLVLIVAYLILEGEK